jgi:hypothetical protein
MDFMQMQPLSISVYRGKSGYPAFSSLFDDTGSRVVILDKPVADFRKEVDPMLASGGLAFDVDSFEVDGALRYSVVLQPGSSPPAFASAKSSAARTAATWASMHCSGVARGLSG